MKTYQVTQNGIARYNVTGKFFRLLTNVNPVDVVFFSGASAVDMATGMDSGFWAEFDVEFDAVQITTAGNEAVKFLVGATRAGLDRMVGSVAVTTLPAVTVNNPFLVTEQRGLGFTSCWSNSAAITANVPITVYAGANPNGIDIYAAKAMVSSAANIPHGGFFISPLGINATVPASGLSAAGSAAAHILMLHASAHYTQWTMACELPNPIRIPAGNGLFFYCSANLTANQTNLNQQYCLFEVL